MREESTPAVFDVPTFCASHRISRSFFYRLLGEGRGPRLLKVGRRTLITAESAAEWRALLENDELSGRQSGARISLSETGDSRSRG